MTIEAPEYQQLVVCDFDETMAVTSESAPNGMNVAKAYELAVETVVGASAIEQYRAQGGLRNRAPSEVIAELHPECNSQTAATMSEDLVATKLSLLQDQIGKRLPDGAFWPRPTTGFVDFWRGITATADITTGVASSGHTSFIERFCEVQEIAAPEIMVTDDDMRPLVHLPTALRTKPGRLILDMVHLQWMQQLEADPANIDELEETRKRILYVGDNGSNKDLGLAVNAGVAFQHIDPLETAGSWQYTAGRIAVNRQTIIRKLREQAQFYREIS